MPAKYTLLVDDHPIGHINLGSVRGSGYRQVLDLSIVVDAIESRHSVSAMTFASDPLGTLLPLLKRCGEEPAQLAIQLEIPTP